jgi:hypothetical protein
MIEEPSSASAPKLLNQVWGKIRLKHCSLRTESKLIGGMGSGLAITQKDSLNASMQDLTPSFSSFFDP